MKFFLTLIVALAMIASCFGGRVTWTVPSPPLEGTGSGDKAFNGGTPVINVVGDESEAFSVAIHPAGDPNEGKIVIAGYSKLAGRSRMLVARYLSDGQIDTGFGSNGTAIFQDGVSDSELKSVVISSSFIFGAGKSVASSGKTQFVAVKLDPAGFPADWGASGFFRLNLTNLNLGGNGVMVDGSDKLVAAGFGSTGASFSMDNYVWRLTGLGILDASGFNVPKGYTDDTVDDYGELTAIMGDTVSPGYLVAGFASAVSSGVTRGALARFDSAGNTAAQATSAFLTHAKFFALAKREGAGINAVGETWNDIAAKQILVTRFNTGLSPDSTTFGLGHTTFAIGSSAGARGAAVNPDESLAVVGTATADGRDSFVLARLTPTGAPDTALSTSGAIMYPVGEGASSGNAIVRDAQGKLVIVGGAVTSGKKGIAILRIVQ